MGAQGYRKIELQSPADFTYLYTNAVAVSRQKLDLNFPPLATDDDTPDPMRERVQELVNEVSQARQWMTSSRMPNSPVQRESLIIHIVYKSNLHNGILLNQHQWNRFILATIPLPSFIHRTGNSRV